MTDIVLFRVTYTFYEVQELFIKWTLLFLSVQISL